jgi:uncharacterized membrane protein
MNSYNNQRQQYQDYATQTSDPIDLQQYERQQFYSTPPMANPPIEPINQPYQQQQPGYMPPPRQQQETYFNLSETDGSEAAGLCYIGFWLTGLLFLIFGNRKRLVRFHAMQNLLFFGGYTVLMIFLIRLIDANLFLINGFAIFALVMLNIIACVGWFVGIIGAFRGKYTKLPIVGDIAENYVNGNIHLK